MTAETKGYINDKATGEIKNNGSEEGDMNNGETKGETKTANNMAKIKEGDFNGVKKIVHTRAKQAEQAQQKRGQRADGKVEGVAYGAPKAIDKNYSMFTVSVGEGEYAQDIDVVVAAGSLPEGVAKDINVSAEGIYYDRYALLSNGKVAVRPTILANECAVVDEPSNDGRGLFDLSMELVALGVGRKLAFGKNDASETDRGDVVFAQIVCLGFGRDVAVAENAEGRSDTLRETHRVVVMSGASDGGDSAITRHVAFTKKGHRVEVRGAASVDVNTGGKLIRNPDFYVDRDAVQAARKAIAARQAAA